MAAPIFLNVRILSKKPSQTDGGSMVELIVSSFAGEPLSAGARFLCEYHPNAERGEFWGVYPPEVRSELKLSYLQLLIGSKPNDETDGAGVGTRNELVASMISRTLNEFHSDRRFGAVLPDEIIESMDNKVFVVEFRASDSGSPIVLAPTGIEQIALSEALAKLSPKFAVTPKFYLEAVNGDNNQEAMKMVNVLAHQVKH